MTKRILQVLCLIAIVSSPAATRAGLTTEDRVQKLEDEIRDMRDQREKLNSDLELNTRSKNAFVKAKGKESALKLGGLIQGQADFGDKGDARFSSDHDRFYLRRARINVSGEQPEQFDFRLEGEFAGSLGETAGMRAQLTDGYATWKKYGFSNIRLGQFKTPYGYEQLALDPGLYTIERSLANDRLTLGRQVGAQASGDLLNQRFSYAGGLFNGTSVNCNSNDNSKFTWVGRLSAVPWETAFGATTLRLACGVNAFISDDNLGGQPSEFGFNSGTGKVDNVFNGTKHGVGIDAQYVLGPFELWAEYLQTRFEPDNKVPHDRLDAQGWYVQGSYFVLPAKLQSVVKYEYYDPDDDKADNETKTWTFGLNYLIKGDDIKLQIDYLRSDLAASGDTENKVLARLQIML